MRERPAGERDFDLSPARAMSATWSRRQAGDMRRIGRRGDGDHGAGLRDLRRRGGQHGGAAEAVADQHRRRLEGPAQMIGGGDQIVRRSNENVVLAKSPSLEPSPVKSNRSTAMPCAASRRDAARRQPVLAAGEAMREQRHRPHRPIRPVEQSCELLAMCIDEIKTFGRHDDLLRG